MDSQYFFSKNCWEPQQNGKYAEKIVQNWRFLRSEQRCSFGTNILQSIQLLELNCQGLVLRTLENSEFCQFESLKIAKNSAKISVFFNKYQEHWLAKIFAEILLRKVWSSGYHISLRCERSLVQSWVTPFSFLSFLQKF